MRGEGVILRREPPFLFARLKPPRQQTELKLWVCGKEFHFIVIVREIFVCLFIWGVVFVPSPPPPPIRYILPPCLPSQGQGLTRISTDFNSKLEIRCVCEGVAFFFWGGGCRWWWVVRGGPRDAGWKGRRRSGRLS